MLLLRWFTVCLVVSVGGGAFASEVSDPCNASRDCVSVGETVEVEFENPDLQADGMPVSSELVEGIGMEQDPGFDDVLGGATVGAETTTLAITNTNGTLVAPNGHSGDGVAGGDCMEIYIEWTIRYKVYRSIETSIGFDGEVAQGTWVWAYFTVSSPAQEICPC